MAKKAADPGAYLDAFFALFRGHTESFVVHEPPFTRDAKRKLTAAKTYYAKDGKEFLPLTRKHIQGHLSGEAAIAISPLFTFTDDEGQQHDDLCLYGIIDVDNYGVDFVGFVNRLRSHGYPAVPFQSKSGGVHIYFFFSAPQKASEVRVELGRIVEHFGMKKLFEKGGKSTIEIFPEHDSRKAGLQDKCVFLPYFDGGFTSMVDEFGDPVPLSVMFGLVQERYTTVRHLRELTDKLPLNDAPYCVQSGLLGGAVGTGGRNNFITTCAIYLQTKDGQSARLTDLNDMNEMLTDPLDPGEVAQIHKSVLANSYSLAGRCSKEPMCSICDAAACKLRKYGVGRDKNNMVLDVEFGKITMYKAEEPYFTWEVRLAGSEGAFKEVRLDSAEELMNQRRVQSGVVKTIGHLMRTVANTKWEQTLQKHLSEKVEQEVTETSDTSEITALKQMVYNYLVSRKVSTNRQHMILMKQVYWADGKSYFTTDGIIEYLRLKRFTQKINLREELLKYGCKEGKLDWKAGDGTVKALSCWVKADDEMLIEMRQRLDVVLAADEGIIAADAKQHAEEDEKFGEPRF